MKKRDAIFDIVDVSRETVERLEHFAGLLEKWNRSINLVAPSTIHHIWTRHILDSAQLFPLAPDSTSSWVDLGTGGGFPGIVIALVAQELRPELVVSCVESDKRKAAFLQTAAAELDLRTRIFAARSESLPPFSADVVSARALAPLEKLISMANRHLNPDGVALFLKGAAYQREVDTALETWSFRLEAHASKTDAEAVVLRLGGFQHV